MKDPRDPGTIDGFADLLESLENEPPKEAPKMTQPQFSPELIALAVAQIEASIRNQKPKRGAGRPPKGERAQTPAEKQKAYRDRQRAARDAAK
ncbi:hypothetical protein QFA96_26890 (plasmid) [Pseudomonas sp. Ap32]|nr:hypothetical protein QFA96_26890 [Pseudomonas sp. Ap32]